MSGLRTTERVEIAADAISSDSRRIRIAMSLRRGFLILAAPLVLFLTISSVLLWRQWWLWLFP